MSSHTESRIPRGQPSKNRPSAKRSEPKNRKPKRALPAKHPKSSADASVGSNRIPIPEFALDKEGNLAKLDSVPDRVKTSLLDQAQERSALLRLMPGPAIGESPFKGGFKETLSVRFPYGAVLRLTPSTTAAYYLFRATDLFDPDYTGTGHQPLGFDQYMLFYNHFVIAKSTIRVTFISENEDPKVGAYFVGLRLGASTTTYSTVAEFMEDPWSTWGYLRAAPFGLHELSHTYEPEQFYGLDRHTLLANPSFWGSVSASPAEEAYFQIAVFSSNPGTADGVALSVAVEIKYHTVLSEPKLLAQS